jgi:tRNA1Val (adenine37-N6)-methyltransferase
LIKRHGLHILKKVEVRQSVHHSPFRTMIFGGKNINSSPQIAELSIWNGHREYTPEFIQLLKDYYLKL